MEQGVQGFSVQSSESGAQAAGERTALEYQVFQFVVRYRTTNGRLAASFYKFVKNQLGGGVSPKAKS